ncbi:hypothetical protein V8C42DRAFT_349404 [Trichoderma barbatum]
MLSEAGVLKPGTAPVEGIFDESKDPAGFPGCGTGEDGTEEFTGRGEKACALERTLLRNNLRGNKATGVHYDYIFLRHGNDFVLTAWVPWETPPLKEGGLIYSKTVGPTMGTNRQCKNLTSSLSHELGKKIEQEFTEKAKATGLTDEEAKFAFNKNTMSGGVLTQGQKASVKLINGNGLFLRTKLEM